MALWRLKRSARAASLLIVLLFSFAAFGGAARAADSLYEVAKLSVDTTAADAVAARAMGMAEAQMRAVKIALQRLVPLSAQEQLPELSQEDVEGMVNGVSIRKEQNSTTRYIATLDVSVSERAWRMHEESTMPRYYFDFIAAKKAYEKDPPQTAWTPAVSVIIQLDIALQQILSEGIENVFERHILLGRAAREGVKGMGLNLFGPDEDLNSAVTAAYAPEGVDGKELVRLMFREHGIQVAGGQGEMSGKIFRIGHCGYFDAYDIIATIAAAELSLESLDFPVELGRGVGAAQRVFSRSGAVA